MLSADDRVDYEESKWLMPATVGLASMSGA
jgi:hypothetical protein